MSETIKLNTIVDSRSGDTPTEIPGQVKPGQTLRERAGIKTKPTEKKPDEKVETKPEKVDKKPAAKKPAAPAPVPPVIDQDVVNAAASTAAVAAVKAIAPKPEEKVEPKETDGLPADSAEVYAVLKRMEAKNPANKGKASEYAKAVKSRAEYQAGWEAKNRGKKFNPDDVEHEEFMASNDVTFNQREFDKIQARMEAEAEMAEKLKPIEERFKKEEEEKANAARRAEVEPIAANQARASSRLLFEHLGGDFADVMDERNFVKKDMLTKLHAENEYMPRVVAAAGDTEAVASELKRLHEGVSKINLKNPGLLHLHICEFIWKEDAKMKAEPPEDQIRDGKMFANTEEVARMEPRSEENPNGYVPGTPEGLALAEKRKHHWAYSDEDFSKLYAADRAKELREFIEADEKSFQERVAKRGLTPSNNGKHVFQPAPKPPIVPPIQRRETSPAAPAMPRMAPSTKSDPNTTTPLRKRLF